MEQTLTAVIAIIISVLTWAGFIVGTWFFQRSAMFSALKKYEKWKAPKDEN